MYFGGKTWGGTTTITQAGAQTTCLIRDANTFGNLTIIFSPTSNYLQFGFGANQTITGTLTITGNRATNRSNIRGYICGYNYTQRTITVNGAVSMTGVADFKQIIGAGTASPGWDLSSNDSGNQGGNSGITFRSATTYYLYCGTANSKQDYDDVYSATDDGESRAAGGYTVHPLPQDTLIIDNYTWDDTGNEFGFHSGGWTGAVDASALTEANTVYIPRYSLGNLTYTGSGVTIGAYGHTSGGESGFDGLLKNDSSATLDINLGGKAGLTGALWVFSCGGTVKLTGGLITTGTFTLTKGTLDLNGNTLTCGALSSSNTNTRELKDTAGGGNIICTGATGTVFDMTTYTNLSVSNSPDVTLSGVLTGTTTFYGPVGKTFGDFWNNTTNAQTVNVNGSNTFNDFKINAGRTQTFTKDTTQTVTSFTADGTSSAITIGCSTTAEGDHFHLHKHGATAVNAINCTISRSQADGEAAWGTTGCTDGGNNTGWVFGTVIPTILNLFRHRRIQ
jgi:hypothetical protein